MEYLNEIWPWVRLVLTILGSISIVIFTVGVIKGVFRILYRLGKNLYQNGINIYANQQGYALKNLLTDSKIFREKKIKIVTSSELDRNSKYRVKVIYYPEMSEQFENIMNHVDDDHAVIVYCPIDADLRLSDLHRRLLNSKRNAALVTMRGRLLNDVFTSMITVDK